MSNNFEVVCFGDINLDYIGKVDRVPEKDEEVPLEDLKTFSGGAGTNVAVALARLGSKVAFIGSIGDDSIGNNLLKEISLEGVDTSHVVIKKGYGTGIVFSIVDNEGERRLLTYSDANLQTKENDFSEKFIKKAKILHMSSPYLPVVPYLINIAKKNNLIVSFDPGTLISRYGIDKIKSILANVDILFLNTVEYQQFTGSSNLNNLDLFIELGCKMIIYKQGKKGSLIHTSRGTEVCMPSFSVKAIDSTGAGDAFAGAFLHGYIRNYATEELMKFSSAVAALSIMQKGAKEGLPKAKEVQTFLKNHTS